MTKPSPAALAISRALIPAGAFLDGLDPTALGELYAALAELHPRAPGIVNGLCGTLDAISVTRTGRTFQRLSPDRQQRLLRRWHDGEGPAGVITRALAQVLKLHYFSRREVHDHFGVPHDKAPSVPEPAPAYMRRAVKGSTLAGEELEAEVVVVGSGAAGAIVAQELAERGHAVLLVEAGRYFRRHDFSGRFLDAATSSYWWRPHNLALGNTLIPITTGRTVGGSTTINTATCFRPPPYVHQRWVEEGLPELAEDQLAPIFAEIEAMLRVAPVPRELWGRHVERMAAFLDSKGISHGPISRNAPDCDGQNCCDMGCPSGGKFSMDLSAVPMALRHGALLLTETELRRVLIREGRVRGVALESRGKRLQVAARRVVLCCGAMATPLLLWDHGLGGSAVGQGLTIHPSSSVSARFGEELRGFGKVVPSSHFIDEHRDRGLMLISANLPVDMAAMPLQLVGSDLMEQVESYHEFGSWGVLLAETGRGRLRRLPDGRAVCSYLMPDEDVARMHEALGYLCALYFEAGARACFPAVRGWPVLRTPADLDQFRSAKISARQLVMTAYHPLGTCRMGRDPRSSVVDPDYELRGVRGLSVVDGSVVPGPIGVNSQLTVMAFALRAARILDRRLEEES
jgi:hypothetical protein